MDFVNENVFYGRSMHSCPIVGRGVSFRGGICSSLFTAMTINIAYHGIDSTPAIAQYVDEKMQGLEKYFGGIQHMDVEVGMASQHHQKGDIFKCKVVIETLKEVICLEKQEEDLYKAIDKVRDHARTELASLKERIQDRQRGEAV